MSEETTTSVKITLDGKEIEAAEGELVIAAAERNGTYIPRFCWHPRMNPVGMCRMCLVEIDTGRGPALQPSCMIPCSDGMTVTTDSDATKKAQEGVLEFLLANHPLDCPVCDKGGECPLQDQAYSHGPGESRFVEEKVHFEKPIAISPLVDLDRERCILCDRCTRFADEVAGDTLIHFIDRGAQTQVNTFPDHPFASYFSGNTVQICPVGALTSATYRFRARPFDLVSTQSVAEHDACGSAIRVDHRRGKVVRRLAGDDPAVNEEWITDKDRFGFAYAQQDDRLTHPMVRDAESGELRVASWPEALMTAARGLKDAGVTGVLTGGRLTLEDAYAYSKFARVALGTNNVDFRARPHSAEEEAFLASTVAGTGLGVTFEDLEKVGTVVLAGLEPEDEAGTLFLRLRKAARKGLRVFSVAPYTSRGLAKMHGTLIRTAPGDEARAIEALAHDGEVALDAGGVILVGERLASVPGALTAALELAGTTGARLAWVPRRAGDRGAVDAGLLPSVLPGGRPVDDAAARVDLGTVWGTTVGHEPGLDATGIIAGAALGEVGGLVVAGVDPDDTPDPAATRAALEVALFVVSLELRATDVTRAADVVFPVAAAAEKAGTFVTWEGRQRPFDKVLFESHALPDLRVLAGIADELGTPLGFKTVEAARAELAELGAWDGARVEAPARESLASARSANADGSTVLDGGLRLATWKQMIDDASMLDGDDYLKATGRAAVALVSAGTLARLGVEAGANVTVTGPGGSATLPVGVADLDDGVVWLPANSDGINVTRDLGATAGSTVSVEGGAA